MPPRIRGNQGLDSAVDRWLEAEASDGDAEQAFEQVFRRLPLPRIDLTAGVFARLGLALPERRWDPFVSWKLRLVLATAAVLAASALALAPWLWPAARTLARPSALGELLGAAIVVAAQWLASGLEWWRLLGSLASALTRFLSIPAVAGTFLLAALVAGGALGTLNRLITPERSFS